MEHADQRGIDPAQADFWNLLAGRVLERGEVEVFGVEYVDTPARLRELHKSHPCPTVVDAGHGIFGAPVALLFVDDDTGRAVAYAPPVIVLRAALDHSASAVRELRDGLAQVDAIASDQWTDAPATVERMQRAAREALKRARLDLDGSGRRAAH